MKSRKKIYGVISMSLLMSLATVQPIFAANSTPLTQATISKSTTASSLVVFVNDLKMCFSQTPVIRDNTVMVPLRDIFEAFGAKVSGNGSTQAIKVVKDGKTMQFKLNSTTAIIGERSVTLATPVVRIKDTAMVPLRFALEALNVGSTWDDVQNRVDIQYDGIVKQPYADYDYLSGIHVHYSGYTYDSRHTYGSDNQAQYDQVVSMAKQELAKKKNMPKFFDEYMSGERFDGNKGNRSDKNVALKNLESHLGSLIQAGVPRETIEKLLQGTMSTSFYIGQAKDNGDAAGQYSAYHTMVEKKTDCDAIAQTHSLMLDLLGFSTGIYHQPGHAEAVVYLPSYGYFFVSGSYFMPTGGPSNMEGQNSIEIGFNK